jgi:hypothetical protein
MELYRILIFVAVGLFLILLSFLSCMHIQKVPLPWYVVSALGSTIITYTLAFSV